MKQVCTMAAAVALSATGWAQALDTTVCDVLANPAAFNGKIVRIKGKVNQGFEVFSISGGACDQDVNAIWLSYPQGANAKAGPVAAITFRLSRNNPAPAAAVPQRTPVKLDKNKDFKQFDSALSAQYSTKSGMCLGCGRNQVTATLTGRLDASESAGIVRDKTGKVIGVQGFGNLNRYRARLVIQSVAEVEIRPVDFSVETSGDPDRPSGSGAGDPISGLRDAIKNVPAGAARRRLEAAVDAYGKPGEDNGVIVGFGRSNEAADGEPAKAASDSPDGLVIVTEFEMDRLKDPDALSTAISHMGAHIADVRDVKKALDGSATSFGLEWRAWQTTVWRIQLAGRRGLILPGGFTIWSATWAPAELSKRADGGVTDFLKGWADLKESTPHNPWQD